MIEDRMCIVFFADFVPLMSGRAYCIETGRCTRRLPATQALNSNNPFILQQFDEFAVFGLFLEISIWLLNVYILNPLKKFFYIENSFKEKEKTLDK